MSQSDFYAIDSVREVRLYFVQSNWDELLDSLYIVGEQGRLVANAIVDGESYLNVGVRYKGFSSYSSSRPKNPLNIDLDYMDINQNHLGYKKIKLSNVIQDPSFVREVLSYEIARKYMPASKANYANVYINDTLIGLYTNVEAVNKDFLMTHFGNNDNTFIKCNPESLDLNGENSNLTDTPGPAIDGYFPFYKLKSDDAYDWFDLQELIDTLNNSQDNIDEVLNIDQTLWMHAFNYTVINFDSYIGYAQNYYLYQDQLGQFNPIIWDLNMSFASYRLTDASDNWDGFTIEEAKYIDPLQHLNSFSVQPRPLIRNLLVNDTYKRMYLAHIRTIVKENFETQDYVTRAQYMQSIADASVLADTNKFYSYTDFTDNLTMTVTDLVDYPGITELMWDRCLYLLSTPGNQNVPDILAVNESSSNTTIGDSMWITADITASPTNVFLKYQLSPNERFISVQMTDDGTQNDGEAGDSLYGALIPGLTNHVEYYIYAENDSAGRFSPQRAAHEVYSIDSKVNYQDLVFNEVMANNQFTQTDQDGEYESWIEVHNSSEASISLDGLYLSNDQFNLMKWPFPPTTIESGHFAIVWADQDMTQYGMHASLFLDPLGDSLWLSYADGTVIDSMSYLFVDKTASTGRYPNGTGAFMEMRPTYNARNTNPEEENYISDDLFVYPNPANGELLIRYNILAEAKISMYSMDGRRVLELSEILGETITTIDTSIFDSGFYIINVENDAATLTKKVLITH